ncbi:Hypothetical protein MBVG_3070 [Mycoplasmopsis bovigenitalium 51080]|uniref:Uncharacterized protein n=1 Tax=Mycoplasmopsis bovigenitalium 51080 TaxID=1188235 RepID=N9V305_9BACT|nr:hypothetical protein [Mycoplasmopsis bovigenitalium]ENY69717.1 Hypothetical protein MBVG_3070 [Mycoplasmopsis bovigenitalium 51080]
MDYINFELKLRQILNKDNGPKLLLKMIEAPYRYQSQYQLFDALTKMNQSFLRTQENKFHRFIIECAESLITNSFEENGIEHIKTSFNLTFIDKSKVDTETNLSAEQIIELAEEVKFKSNLAFIDTQSKKMYIVFARKHDTFDKSSLAKLLENITKRNNALINSYQDYQINFIYWFIDEFYTKNFDVFHSFSKQNESENNNIMFLYGSQFLSLFNLQNDWDNIQSHMKKFKNNSIQDIYKMPNLNKDPETFEFMVEMSAKNWEKLSSDEPDMINLRNIVFDNQSESSNYIRAMRERNQKLSDEFGVEE